MSWHQAISQKSIIVFERQEGFVLQMKFKRVLHAQEAIFGGLKVRVLCLILLHWQRYIFLLCQIYNMFLSVNGYSDSDSFDPFAYEWVDKGFFYITNGSNRQINKNVYHKRKQPHRF